ncbi:hypothetical protein [Snodgrassella alvi]|uniref:hypothetical protein n=1 Tax=Snodgrassella alvi TaxID=1196083 RepID=UPI001551C5B0|nr:hypothetical protein [Snodgrassella alvi]
MQRHCRHAGVVAFDSAAFLYRSEPHSQNSYHRRLSAQAVNKDTALLRIIV